MTSVLLVCPSSGNSVTQPLIAIGIVCLHRQHDIRSDRNGLIHRLGRYLRKRRLINRVSQKGVGRLGISGVSGNCKESGDGCQCDDTRDLFCSWFLWFLLSFSLRPTAPWNLRSSFVFYSQANN